MRIFLKMNYLFYSKAFLLHLLGLTRNRQPSAKKTTYPLEGEVFFQWDQSQAWDESHCAGHTPNRRYSHTRLQDSYLAVLIIICKYLGGAGAVLEVCGAVGELLLCARKKLERAVSELYRARGRGQGGELLKLIEGRPSSKGSGPILGPRYGGSAGCCSAWTPPWTLDSHFYYSSALLAEAVAGGWGCCNKSCNLHSDPWKHQQDMVTTPTSSRYCKQIL